MLRREMMALGVLEQAAPDLQMALGDPGFPFNGLPQTESINWSSVWQEPAPPGSVEAPGGHPDSPSVLVG